MEILATALAAIIALIPIGLFVYCLWQFGLFIYHWSKVIENVSNKYAAIMGPFLFMDKNNFSEEGQLHLEKMKQPMKRGSIAIIPVLLFMLAVSFIPGYEL